MRTSRAANTTPAMDRKVASVIGRPATWRTAAIDSTTAAGLEPISGSISGAAKCAMRSAGDSASTKVGGGPT
eukprot:8268149-Alexandrium_andersonii.AAC.1